jgi:hypothetical protein
MFDLWDVESRKYFGSFATEDAALRRVAGLLASNGDEYAEVLELGASDDEFGEHNLTGAALVQRVRARLALAHAHAGQAGTRR